MSISTISLKPLRVQLSDLSGGITDYNLVITHIARHHGRRAYDGVFSDRHARQDGCAGPDPRTFPDHDGLAREDLPVIWIMVVGQELHVGGDLHIVFDRYAAPRHCQ